MKLTKLYDFQSPLFLSILISCEVVEYKPRLLLDFLLMALNTLSTSSNMFRTLHSITFIGVQMLTLSLKLH